jgi:hypothetical protein
MTGFAQAKVHLLDETRTNMRVSICGMFHPSHTTTDPAKMTCKHCLKVQRRIEGAKA